MTERFAIADTHFGHANILTFKRRDGTPLREFASVEEMDETMVERWNAVVGPKDKVYHLGDVVINRRCLKTLARLNGRKVLVKGNHDPWKLSDLTPYFEDIMGVAVFVDDFIMSHIPLHPESITTRFKANVHGHLHSNRVMWQVRTPDEEYWDYSSDPPRFLGAWREEIDPRYLCVSVEHTDYSPISFDEVRTRIKEQQDG